MSKSYIGVSYKPELFKFASIVSQGGTTYRCGFHDTEKEAAMARDKMIIKHGLSTKLQVLKPIKKSK